MIGLLDNEMLVKFVDFVNSNTDEAWTIIINSGGGNFLATETITRIVNLHKETEIIVQAAFSAGFLFLIETKCKKTLSRTCRGMWHYGRWSIEYNDKHKPYYYDDECIIRNLPFHKKHSQSLAKKIMNTTEYKDFLKDRDVYFDFKRMKEIFPNAEVI
jgi:ATP-dependent protease ClpP protease subunit